MTLQKYFSHPSLVIYFFQTPHPPPKTKTGMATSYGTTNSKPLGPIIMTADKNQCEEEVIHTDCCAFHHPPHSMPLC
jgi:hypothetical protein